jgi:threonine synthase
LRYVSTRGIAPELGFSDVLLTGLAPDGGLYVPRSWPRLGRDEIAAFAEQPYATVAADLAARFCGGEIPTAALRKMCDHAYAGFSHPAVAPLVQRDVNYWLLELFHGPTFAFKDLAMQLLARMMDHVLSARDARATIVVATSGDTGGSAIEAFRGAANVDLFVLFPKGRVSPVQQRQMTTAHAANIHPIAIEGSFDDCQARVKGLFANERLRRLVSLTAVNSINWARIVAQTTYYFTSAVAIGAPERVVSFCVPTGNFGDVFAGHVAAEMGLPVEQLVVATNSNDILARTLATGRYEVRDVVSTSSPSMDIQVSSNFERLLWLATGGDGEAVGRLMGDLKRSGSFTIDKPALEWIRQRFAASRATEKETAMAMAEALATAGYLADPHSAVAMAVADRLRSPVTPMVALATAHPAKFPDAVEAATGKRPAMPPRLAALEDKEEQYVTLADDIAALERHVESHAQAARLEA